ncbi:MAG TPA: hypothetical protein VFG16_28200 [Streptomyces sp.]|nr:hypothetical protein [Streptomyces sp.]
MPEQVDPVEPKCLPNGRQLVDEGGHRPQGVQPLDGESLASWVKLLDHDVSSAGICAASASRASPGGAPAAL